MLYIIGIDHLVQYSGPLPEKLRIEFREYVVWICRQNTVLLIAEEFCEESLRDVYHANAETAQEAAALLGIEHRYCDPESSELTRMGIPSYAGAMDQAKTARGIQSHFIINDDLRKLIKRETEQIVRSHWHLREQYWYERLRDRLDRNILFLCGHEHAERFKSLLDEKGHYSEILNKCWKEEIFRDYVSLGIG
jgi:hypothetical protein